MMYRDHRQYSAPTGDPNHSALRSWLRGEAGVEGLKEWLRSMYN